MTGSNPPDDDREGQVVFAFLLAYKRLGLLLELEQAVLAAKVIGFIVMVRMEGAAFGHRHTANRIHQVITRF
jgi:hypothetical protein